MIRTYKYKLLPSKAQRFALKEILETQRQLWNGALQERISYYEKTGKSLSFFDQCKSLTICRDENPEMRLLPTNLQRGTLKRLHASYNLFFSNLKRKNKVSLPRFKGYGSFDCISFDTWSGVRLINGKLRFKGISPLRIHYHRDLPVGKPKSCQIFRRANGWFIAFQMEVEPKPLLKTGKSCGIDLGIENHLTFDDDSTIELERFNVLERRRKKAQRKLARAKRGSNNRKKAKLALAKVSLKIKNARSTRLRQIASDICKRYDIIAIERLNSKDMLSKEKNYKGLNRSLSSASFGLFTKYLTEKAESAARELILVDPKGTSQTCPDCGTIKKKKLSQRMHNCTCGSKMHRDVAAAKVILSRGQTSLSAAA